MHSKRGILACIARSRLQLGPGHLLYDPFVGTGSVIVAAAALARGCVVFGADIDARVLRGKQGRTMHSNFAQYGLQPHPDALLMDNSSL